MIDSTTGLPESYEEMFDEYFDYVKLLVKKAGITVEDVEDVAMSIFTTFMEKDALAWYDPNKLHDVGDKPRVEGARQRTARFPGLLRRFVNTYVLQHRDKQKTRAYKEPIRCETPVITTDAGDVGTWIEVFGPATMPDNSLDFWNWVQTASDHLESLPVRGQRDLARVFRSVVEQVAMDGKVDRKVIASDFGVSDTFVCQIFKDLRAELEKMGWARMGATGMVPA